MPKLPKGMKRRRNAYYLRRTKDGREVWAPLGSDYTEACRQLRELKREPVVANTGSVLGSRSCGWSRTSRRVATRRGRACPDSECETT